VQTIGITPFQKKFKKKAWGHPFPAFWIPVEKAGEI
jgi:hypothetical protein